MWLWNEDDQRYHRDEYGKKGRRRRKRGNSYSNREDEKTWAMPVLEASMLEEAREK